MIGNIMGNALIDHVNVRPQDGAAQIVVNSPSGQLPIPVQGMIRQAPAPVVEAHVDPNVHPRPQPPAAAGQIVLAAPPGQDRDAGLHIPVVAVQERAPAIVPANGRAAAAANEGAGRPARQPVQTIVTYDASNPLCMEFFPLLLDPLPSFAEEDIPEDARVQMHSLVTSQ